MLNINNFVILIYGLNSVIFFNFNLIINGDIRIFDKKLWPPMKNIDIWSINSIEIKNQKFNTSENINKTNNVFYKKNSNTFKNETYQDTNNLNRQSKVLNFFPVPVDDECLSDDERRYGTCFNPYECRNRGGQAKGECALGFGVCCVFLASCDQEIKNNITYLISPNFPSFMPNNLTSCKVKIKMMNPDITQLRIDFHHFLLGQPNRTNGNCDGDVFKISKGNEGIFKLCGQNSGQHVYYDIVKNSTIKSRNEDNNLPNKNSTIDLVNDKLKDNKTENLGNSVLMDEKKNDTFDEHLEILITFSSTVIQTRFWEIRIMQIPFSQKAPAGCLQYFTEPDGVIQTFNFADNGRHLSQQNYKACIRQNENICSITYEPCREHSFRIGPSGVQMDEDQTNQLTNLVNVNKTTSGTLNDDAPISTTTASIKTTAQTTTTTTITTTTSQSPLISSTQQADEAIEGSGGGEISNIQLDPPPSRPSRGGFDLLSFLKTAFFDFRSARSIKSWKNQGYFVRCRDRITMPCIVEDFIIPDPLDPANINYEFPNCQPVHCGNSFCPNGIQNCKIESTVKPFYLGIHFGEGTGKGSPEDNIGACLKYKQMTCL